MLNTLIAIALAAATPQPNAGQPAVPYADCLLSHIQPGLSDQATRLVQQACASKHPEGFVASMELERRLRVQRQTEFDAQQAATARAANAAAMAAQRAADEAAARNDSARAK